ncbi:LuxR C-terminal-related transcriptional regulator [Cohnella cellulosilytica]|uniref:LuxR C-terminal-related transcriptional regulator n=1 Tax=Cohnella cellulosilytica TaxID=986710 RepID=A0ABW2FGZ2_9BACL
MKQRIERLAEQAVSSREFRLELLARLREAFPFDGACCSVVDPRTLLSAGAVTEDGVEAIHHRLFEYEYGYRDYNRFEELAEADRPAAALGIATEGDPERSARFREVLRPAGFGDEMRAALVSGGRCWGFLTLLRGKDRPSFTEEELVLLTSLVPTIASALRRTSLALSDAAEEPGLEPGVLVVVSDGVHLAELSATDAAARWLAALREAEGIGAGILPRPIRAVCTRALAGETGTGKELANGKAARTCVRLSGGSYVTIRADKLVGQASALQLAVVFELAQPADRLPLIAEAYGLSEREKQLLGTVVRGLSTREISRELHISVHTVQDHLKSIFAKTGVSSRRELIWRLFSRYASPPNAVKRPTEEP